MWGEGVSTSSCARVRSHGAGRVPLETTKARKRVLGTGVALILVACLVVVVLLLAGKSGQDDGGDKPADTSPAGFQALVSESGESLL